MLSKIGQFQVEKQIAQGGQARIYQCVKDAQTYAIKVYTKHNEKQNHLFSDESQLMQSLHHKGILSPQECRSNQTITMLDEEQMDRNIIIMKYMKNGDLMNYIIDNGRIDESILLRIVRSILECLKYLSEREIYHCDIKPENILLNQRYQPVLIDFGFVLSKLSKKEKTYPKQYYIAPEVKKGLAYTEKSEAFSFGVLIFTLAMGCPPFKQTKHTDIVYRALLEGKHQAFWRYFEQNLKFSLSSNLKNVIVNLMEPNPKRRWSFTDLNESEWMNEDVISESEYLQYFEERQPVKRTAGKIIVQFPFTDNEQTASKSLVDQNM